MEDKDRCPWAIRYGFSLRTRCRREIHEPKEGHEGNGLEDYPYQTINWFAGDQREFLTSRTDTFSWEDS